ncbi:MAG: DMT family transporter [Nocardioides sp.]
MEAILLALAASLLWGGSDFGGGVMAQRRSAYAVVAAVQGVGLLSITVVALATGGFAIDGPWLRWGVMSGAMVGVALVCLYAALASGTMGVVSPIAALGAIVPFTIGLLTGDDPTSLALIGAVLALAGAVLASGPELSGGASARPVILAAVAGVLFGLALITIAKGSEHSAVMTLWALRLTSVTALGAILIATRTTGGLSRSDALPLLVIGLGDVFANLAMALATQRGYVSIVAVLSSLYPVVTVFLAWLFLKERMLRIQQIGVAFALLGVALVSVGQV